MKESEQTFCILKKTDQTMERNSHNDSNGQKENYDHKWKLVRATQKLTQILKVKLIYVFAGFPATEDFDEAQHFHGSLWRGYNCTGLRPHTRKGQQSSIFV